MSTEKTFILALDGANYNLVKKFNCKSLLQDYHGEIDNYSGMSSIKTSELFASFITGEVYSVHGVKGMKVWKNPKQRKIYRFLANIPFLSRYKRLWSTILSEINSFEGIHKRAEKEDLQTSTWFEEIEDSRAMFVPSYNPSEFWLMGEGQLLSYRFGSKDIPEIWDEYEFSRRKQELEHELDSDILPARDLLMCHIHRIDLHQHYYGTPDLKMDEKKLKKLYKDIERWVEEIREKALNKGYENFLIMSDHGVPYSKDHEKEGHNKNAFYSCNRSLFPEDTPSITDFHDRILEIVGEE